MESMMNPIQTNMSEGTQNPLIRFFTIIAIIFLVILSISVVFDIKNKTQGQIVTNEDKGTISVQGVGTVYATPDVASVNIGVETHADTIEEALEESTRKMNNIINYTKSEGVADEDLKTIYFNISPEYQYDTTADKTMYPDGKVVITGYKIEDILSVKIRDVSNVGNVIQKCLDGEANTVSSLTFIVDDDDQYKAEARTQSIANAQAIAQSIASGLGVSLGEIVSYSEWESYYASTSDYRALGAGSLESSDIQLETGQNKIEITTNITFGVK